MSYGHSLGLSNAEIHLHHAERQLWITTTDIVSQFARWAIQQSPYPLPDGLETACTALWLKLNLLPEFGPMDDRGNRWGALNLAQLMRVVGSLSDAKMLMEIPEVAAWNEPKSGHGTEFVCSSRYGSPAPDDDIIDIHALAHNVAYSVFRSALLDSDLADSEPSVGTRR